MVKTFIASAVMCVLVLGCGKEPKPELGEIEGVIDAAIRTLGEPNKVNPWYRYTEVCQSTTNLELRAQYSRLRDEKLLLVEIVGEDYEKQSRLFTQVALGLSGPRIKFSGRWTLEDDYAAQIAKLTWMRRQLNKWKPMVGKNSEMLRNESRDKYRAWKLCYQHCLGMYESCLYVFEKRFDEYSKMLQADEQERKRVRVMIESYLGRKIRTKEEMEESFRKNLKSEEMRAIK